MRGRGLHGDEVEQERMSWETEKGLDGEDGCALGGLRGAEEHLA